MYSTASGSPPVLQTASDHHPAVCAPHEVLTHVLDLPLSTGLTIGLGEVLIFEPWPLHAMMETTTSTSRSDADYSTSLFYGPDKRPESPFTASVEVPFTQGVAFSFCECKTGY